MRGGDVSPAVEGTCSGSRGSIRAESRPTNRKETQITVIRDRSTITENEREPRVWKRDCTQDNKAAENIETEKRSSKGTTAASPYRHQDR